MKRLYQLSKWKKHSLSVTRHTLKLKRRYHLPSTPPVPPQNIPDDKRITSNIDAPRNYSIINNTDEMLRFFEKINKFMFQGRHVFINMHEVKNITTDALLYLLALFDFYKKKNLRNTVSGNEPQDVEARKMIIESGFYDYVIPRRQIKTVNTNIIRIKSGEQVEPTIVKEIIDFTKSHLKIEKSRKTANLYATIIECMGNTRHHAYTADNTWHKWWLIASFDELQNKVNFTFLDTGLGIPTTIRKKFAEIVKRFLRSLDSSMIGASIDSILIKSALEGKFRTRIKVVWRGKGLPEIFSYAKNKDIDDLILISQKGYVNASLEKYGDISRLFHGSLLTWNFVTPKPKEYPQ